MDNSKQDLNIGIKPRIIVALKTLRLTWQVRPGAVIAYFSASLLEIGSMIVSLYATAKLGALLASYVFTGQAEGIWFWLWVDVVAIVITSLSMWMMGYVKNLIYFSLVQRSTVDFLTKFNRIDLQSFYDEETRNLMNKVGSSYTWQLPNLSWSVLDLIYAIMRFIAIAAVVAQISWWIVPLIAIFLIPSLIGESMAAKTQWFVWDSKGDSRHVFWGLESIIKQARGQMELRTSQAAKFVLGKIQTMNKTFYLEQERVYKRTNRIFIFARFTDVAGTVIGSIVLIMQLLDKVISFEKYLFVSAALLRISSALNNIFGTLARMQESLLFAHSYFEFQKVQPTITDPDNAVKLRDQFTPKIEFKNVSFAYPGKNTAVISNLSFTINPGEHVALVGENGAGKSTIIKLLLRFYVPTSGSILIDDKDLNSLSIDSWYALLATLFQEFNQYPLSIAENIEIGRSDQKQDKKKLESAGKFGNVDHFVNKYKHGWDTVLDASFKKGVEPSGGQWQRVALARAFYRNANVIILDEPTSAIDSKAEYDIFNNIFSHYKDKSALIVSHRFSTVRRASRILVIDEGRIIEEGTHANLMKMKGLYHDLFTKQAEGYRD